MIKIVKLECPACGGTLKKKKWNQYSCSYCNADYILDQDIIIPAPASTPTKPGNAKPLIYFLVGLCILCIAYIFFSQLIPKKATTQGPVPPTAVTVPEKKDEGMTNACYIALVQEAYGKEPSQVSPQEFERLTGLRYDMITATIYYRMDMGEYKKMPCPEEGSIYDCDDLRFFPGLRVLDIEGIRATKEGFGTLSSLEELNCKSSPAQLAEYLPHPEKMTRLKCQINKSSLENSADMSGLEKFTGLIELALSMDSDITTLPEGLATLTNLESLTLKANGISGLAPLENMTKLKVLSLDCKELKDIGFLSAMPDLTELTLSNSKVVNNEPLKDVPGLKLLHLSSNLKMNDYTVISELTSLEDLTISFNYFPPQPDFSKLTQLKKLNVSFLQDLADLRDLTKLEDVCLYLCDCRNFAIFKNFKELKHLKIRSCDQLQNVDVLTSLEQLETVDFSSYENYGDNIESLFSIPNLKELNLNFCKSGINIDKVKTNESLQILRMNDVSFLENVYVESYGGVTDIYYDHVYFNQHTDLLLKFPNLKELYLQSNELLDVEPIASLDRLEILDITNNNITDLSPLSELKNLKIVYGGENAISKGIDPVPSYELDLTTTHETANGR